jgi:hypothetical protein
MLLTVLLYRILQDAERKAEQKIAREEEFKRRGDDKWMLPDLGGYYNHQFRQGALLWRGVHSGFFSFSGAPSVFNQSQIYPAGITKIQLL